MLVRNGARRQHVRLLSGLVDDVGFAAETIASLGLPLFLVVGWWSYRINQLTVDHQPVFFRYSQHQKESGNRSASVVNHPPKYRSSPTMVGQEQLHFFFRNTLHLRGASKVFVADVGTCVSVEISSRGDCPHVMETRRNAASGGCGCAC